MAEIESTTDAKRGQQAVTGGNPSYYGLGGDAALIHHVHLQWDPVLVATITFWSCDFPEQGVGSVAIDSTVAGDWIQEDPPTGYTAISPAGAATVATPLVISIPGGTAGGASVQISGLGSKRLRARVVCTTAGFLRIHTHGKG